MQKYKLKISYDGTRYSGWQVQPSGTSIQQLLQEGAGRILQSPIGFTGSGRTDAGVHAHAQVAHIAADLPDPASFLRSLNAVLPDDIRILSIETAPETFHARYSARGKIYHYNLWLDKTLCPFARKTHLHYPYAFDQAKVSKAAQILVGTHDFTSFANSPTQGSVAKNPVRTIHRIDLIEQRGGIRFEFAGNGFLYKMVRNIVGTLLDVAAGKRDTDDIAKTLAARDRRQAGQAAPPHGLFLMEVEYDELV